MNRRMRKLVIVALLLLAMSTVALQSISAGGTVRCGTNCLNSQPPPPPPDR